MLWMWGRGILPYLLGRSDLRKTFVAAGHSSCLCSFLPSLAPLKGFCAIQVRLTLTVGLCVLAVSERAVADHTDARELVLVLHGIVRASVQCWTLELSARAVESAQERESSSRAVGGGSSGTQLPGASCWWR